MAQQQKSTLYQALKGLGHEFAAPYNKLTTDELKDAYAAYVASGLAPELSPAAELPPPTPPAPDPDPAPADSPSSQPVQGPAPTVPVAHRNPEEMAGERQNTNPDLEPIREDPDTGFIWYQEEVQKASYAKPRGRRILKYIDPGVKTQTAQDGEYTEEFEVAGDRRLASEAKITLPSYQVGIYKDPRYPFKIHVYNEVRGFDLFEVENYWGGPERVPEDVKRMYVENVLCYDIRTVVRAIESEYRRLQLAGKV